MSQQDINTNYTIYSTKFYNYDIYYVIINGITMYLVSSLLNQYNKINNKNKRISDWLHTKDTSDVIRAIYSEYKKQCENENSACGKGRAP